MGAGIFQFWREKTEMAGKSNGKKGPQKKPEDCETSVDCTQGKETEKGNIYSQEKLCDENNANKTKKCQLNKKLRSRAI